MTDSLQVRPLFLITGFPGFLASDLLPRLLRNRPDAIAVCIVQARYMDQAKLKALKIQNELGSERIQLLEGDITQPELGLSSFTEYSNIQQIFHLAAVYDLEVSRDLGMKINVEGTNHVLAFADRCPHLERFQYISTCYVSGRYDGKFSEADLVKGQKFNNFYEETKYLAEVNVQERMKKGLPATIYRPAIVVGDSKTGETQKADGPYFVIQWLLRQSRIAILPLVGNPETSCLNLVPRDFITDAISKLCFLPETRGKIFQLADPQALPISALISNLKGIMGKIIISFPMPLRLTQWLIRYVPGVYRVLRIPAKALDYFAHPTIYTTEGTAPFLKQVGLVAPSFIQYSPQIVHYAEKHPEISSSAMI